MLSNTAETVFVPWVNGCRVFILTHLAVTRRRGEMKMGNWRWKMMSLTRSTRKRREDHRGCYCFYTGMTKEKTKYNITGYCAQGRGSGPLLRRISFIPHLSLSGSHKSRIAPTSSTPRVILCCVRVVDLPTELQRKKGKEKDNRWGRIPS